MSTVLLTKKQKVEVRRTAMLAAMPAGDCLLSARKSPLGSASAFAPCGDGLRRTSSRNRSGSPASWCAGTAPSCRSTLTACSSRPRRRRHPTPWRSTPDYRRKAR